MRKNENLLDAALMVAFAAGSSPDWNPWLDQVLRHPFPESCRD
jgi:hypothetical protein